MNKLLERQIAKHQVDPEGLSPELRSLLETIDHSYNHFEKDRVLLERSIDISSRELQEINASLKRENEEGTRALYEQLKESLRLINQEDEQVIYEHPDYKALSELIESLKKETQKRKIAELELQHSEYRFRSLIENASDAVIIVNEQLEVIYASDSLQRVIGYTPGEVMGLNCFSELHPEDVQKMEHSLQEVLRNPGKTIRGEYRRKNRGEVYVWLESSATNLIHVAPVGGIVVNLRDISDRKKAESALKAFNEELRKSNSELDRFVYSVSHDLRAPLASMLGVISLIESEEIDDSIREEIDLLKQSINRLDGFITDILNYSRNTRLEVKPRKICLKKMLTEITDNLQYMTGEYEKVEVELEVDARATFHSDPTRLRVVFNNLISNAIRYCDPTKTQCRVKLRVSVDEHEARIILADNGIGIEAENQSRIFDMFYRVSNKSIGSGLGLYIVKETLDKLNGSIQMKSTYAKGSVFLITLPNSNNNKT